MAKKEVISINIQRKEALKSVDARSHLFLSPIFLQKSLRMRIIFGYSFSEMERPKDSTDDL
jgi:hypothetical protein